MRNDMTSVVVCFLYRVSTEISWRISVERYYIGGDAAAHLAVPLCVSGDNFAILCVFLDARSFAKFVSASSI